MTVELLPGWKERLDELEKAEGNEPIANAAVEPGDTTSEFFGALIAGWTSIMTLVVSESDAVKIAALAAFVLLALGYCGCRTWRKKDTAITRETP